MLWENRNLILWFTVFPFPLTLALLWGGFGAEPEPWVWLLCFVLHWGQVCGWICLGRLYSPHARLLPFRQSEILKIQICIYNSGEALLWERKSHFCQCYSHSRVTHAPVEGFTAMPTGAAWGKLSWSRSKNKHKKEGKWWWLDGGGECERMEEWVWPECSQVHGIVAGQI